MKLLMRWFKLEVRPTKKYGQIENTSSHNHCHSSDSQADKMKYINVKISTENNKFYWTILAISKTFCLYLFLP